MQRYIGDPWHFAMILPKNSQFRFNITSFEPFEPALFLFMLTSFLAMMFSGTSVRMNWTHIGGCSVCVVGAKVFGCSSRFVSMRFSQQGHDASWQTFWNIAFVCFCFVAGPDHVVRWLQQSEMSVAVSLLASARRLQRGCLQLQGWRRRCPLRRILQTQDWHGSRRSETI